MTFQNSSNDLLVISKYLVSPTGDGGKFTTIQGAITEATADGASAAAPLVIVIKPGTYTENITLADGIHLYGIDGGPSVTIDGTVTLAAGTTFCENITFAPTLGDIFSISGGTLNFNICTLSVTTGEVFVLTTATAKTITTHRCTILGNATSTLATHDGAAATVSLSFIGTSLFFSTVTTISGADGAFTITSFQTEMTQAWDFQCDSIIFSIQRCGCTSLAATVFVTTAADTTGAVDFTNSTVSMPSGVALMSIGNAAVIVRHEFTGVRNPGGFEDSTFASSQVVRSTVLQYYDSADPNTSGVQFSSDRTGFTNADQFWCQGFVQTNDAVATSIFTFTLAEEQGITIEGTVSGKQDDTTDYCGGNVIGCARRDTAGSAVLVGAQANVFEDSAGAPTFDINVSGNDVRVQVTGTGVEEWNWAATIRYQRIQTNT